MTSPLTPYPDVNTLLLDLIAGVHATLSDQLVGMYLFGSLASGDFDQDSDVDVLVVTAEPISEDQFAALSAVHERLSALDNVWAIQLEVSYINQHALRRYNPAQSIHPHIDRGPGERLHWVEHDSAWLIQRSTLRKLGVTLLGPAPERLIDPVSAEDLRQAMLALLKRWAIPISEDPTKISGRGYQSYTVLSLCRILYTLQTGAVVSKPMAARWAKSTLDPHWIGLIERAWIGRHYPSLPAEPADMAETQEFIRFALEESKIGYDRGQSPQS